MIWFLAGAYLAVVLFAICAANLSGRAQQADDYLERLRGEGGGSVHGASIGDQNG